MIRSARRVATLTCTILVLVCGGCGGDASGPYSSTVDVPVSVDIDVTPSVDIALQPEIPDLSSIELEPVESLHVKITYPTAASSFASNLVSGEQPYVILGGRVQGAPDSFYIRSDFQEEPILVEVKEDGSFQTEQKVLIRPPIDTGTVLEAQPTTLWAVAQQGDKRAYDVVVVVANPGFVFPNSLRLTPDVLFAGEPNELLFSLDLNVAENFLADQVWILEVEADCKTKISGSARQLLDDGDIDANGDQLALDKVYSAYMKLNDLEAGTHFFRAAITTAQEEKPLVAYSQCLPVRVVERISAANCAASRDVLKEAQAMLDESLAAGWPLDDARRYAVANLRTEPSVAEAGAAEKGDQVWVRFASGLLGAVHPTNFAPTQPTVLFGEDGVPPSIQMQPWSRLVVSLLSSGGETHPWQETIENSTCPPWRDLAASSQTRLARRMVETGLFFFAGRGGPVFGGLSDEARLALDSSALDFDAPAPAWTGWDHAGTQEVLWLEDDWSCDTLGTTYQTCKIFTDGSCVNDGGNPCAPDKECIITHGKDDKPSGILFDRTQADLAVGRLVLGADGLGMTPSFVANYATNDLSGQLVWLGFPYSGESSTTALEFLAAGANGVVTNVSDVSPPAAEKAGAALFEMALADKLTVAEILPALGASFSDHGWRLLGSGNVDLTFSGLINPDFATGSARGWVRDGDARVLFDWCDASPPTKHMAVLSNGLAYAVDRGELSQEFCLSTDTLVFEAWYNFISHEFLDSCGTKFYEDRFQLYIEDGTGQRVDLAATEKHDFIGINALCPCEAGDCGSCEQCGTPACDCGELFNPALDMELSIWPDECRFDADAWGDAFSSGWRYTGEVALTNLGKGGYNKPVRLVMRVSDESGSKGNTAVLVDSLILK